MNEDEEKAERDLSVEFGTKVRFCGGCRWIGISLTDAQVLKEDQFLETKAKLRFELVKG